LLLLLLGLAAPSREAGGWSPLRFGSSLGLCHRWWRSGLSGPAADSVRLVVCCCRPLCGWILQEKMRIHPRAFLSSRGPEAICLRRRDTGHQFQVLSFQRRPVHLCTLRSLRRLFGVFLHLPLVLRFESLLISVGRFVEARPFGSTLSLQLSIMSTHRCCSVFWTKVARRVSLGRLLSPRRSFTPRASKPVKSG
jgi:hypothetical protein